jgi:hypothetical protein
LRRGSALAVRRDLPTLPLMKNTERCEVVADAATDIKVRLFDRVTEIQPFLEALPPAKYV